MATAYDLIEQNILEYKELEKYLTEKSELTFLVSIQIFALKSILLSIASLYETEIIKVIHEILETSKSEILYHFINRKALERQYFQLFDWDGNNANKFYSYFGKDFLEYAKKCTREDDEINESTKNFIELGGMRNQLVHVNYLTFSLAWTIEDIEEKYIKSKKYPQILVKLFSNYSSSMQKDPS